MYREDLYQYKLDRDINPGPTYREIEDSVAGITPVYRRAFEGLLGAQHELCVAALDDLGFDEADGIPAVEQVQSAISPSTMKWLAGRGRPFFQLIIAPSVQQVGLIGSRHEPGVVTRFDEKQGRLARTKVSKSWLSYGDHSPVHDHADSGSFSTALLLHDHAEAPSPTDTINGQETADQIYQYNASVERKKAALENEQAEQATHRRRIEPITIAQILALEAQGRQLGQVTFHQLLGSTMLIHYPTLRNGNFDCIPTFGREGLHGRRAVMAERWTEIASEPVRRVLQLEIAETDAS